MKRVASLLAFMLAFLTAVAGGKRIFVLSDVHVMAPELLVNDGKAFQEYVANDPKLLQYSAEVFDCMVDTIKKYAPDLVLIPGDMTKDGELVSHRVVAATLAKLRDDGIRVLLVPGNHDIDNPEGRYFDGDNRWPSERTSPEMFAEIYHDYGYDEDAVRDPNSLSWICEPLPGLVIIGFDSNWYYKNQYKEKGDPQDENTTDGGIRTETLEWAMERADQAVAEGKMVVAMTHHNLIEHYDGQSVIAKPYVVDDWENVAKTFVAHGIRLVFTGHQHLQDIAKHYVNEERTDSIIDVSTGSTVSYPNPWRVIDVSDDLTTWELSYGFVNAIPSLDDVKAMCRKNYSDNIKGGLGWHIRHYWDKIQEVIEANGELIEKWKVDVPKTPDELTKLAMDYFGDLLEEMLIIQTEGNENDNPRSAEILPTLKTRLRKLLDDRVGALSAAAYAYVDKRLEESVYPWLTSMLTDTNQWGTNLASVTDDQTGKERGGNNWNDNPDGDGRYYDLNGRFVGTELNDVPSGIYVTKGKKVLKFSGKK